MVYYSTRITTQSHLTTDPSSCLVLVISLLGFLSLLKHSISLLKWVLATFVRHPKNLKNYGSWALITGATDGIGKAFAYQLAEKGLHLVLVSRSHSKLKTVSSEIQAGFPDTKIKIVEFDFSSSSSGLRGVHQAIDEAIKGLNIGVLINNVGITYPARFFHEVDEEVWMNVVRVNLEGTTMVTRAVLQGMLERGQGAIVNIGSGAASVVPSHPLFAIYAATKAYVDQLSRCLYVEYKASGIDVQCQVPLYVATKMASEAASIERSSLFVPAAEDYARAAIRRIGHEARCTPYWTHAVQWFLASLVPEPVLDSWRLAIGIHRRRRGRGRLVA